MVAVVGPRRSDDEALPDNKSLPNDGLVEPAVDGLSPPPVDGPAWPEEGPGIARLPTVALDAGTEPDMGEPAEFGYEALLGLLG